MTSLLLHVQFTYMRIALDLTVALWADLLEQGIWLDSCNHLYMYISLLYLLYCMYSRIPLFVPWVVCAELIH